jgi:hypothetical protein
MRVIHDLQTGEITQEEVPAEEIAALQAAEAARLAAITYAEKRAAEYPSFADQFDLLYHGGYDAWKAAIQVIKDKYPK